MEEPDPLNKSHFTNNQKPSKSLSLFTCILIILIIILLFLFPSQPPQFINQTLFSKLWELIHLLFIGILICYGLFGRRNTRIEPMLDSNERYLSGFSQLSSVFDNGFENLNGYDEKLNRQSYGFEIESGSDKKKISRKQDYVVALEKSVLDSSIKPKLVIDDYKPLNLPVRSLKLKSVEKSDAESVEKMGTDIGSVSFFERNDRIVKGQIRGLIPVNLEKKFEEAVTLPSPVAWNSRSSRMEVRENAKHHPSHTRLLSETSNQVGDNVCNVVFSSFGDCEKFNSQSIPNTMKVRKNEGTSKVKQNLGKVTHLRDLPDKEPKEMKVRDEIRKAKSPPCVRPLSVTEFENNEKKLELRTDCMETRGKESDAKSLAQSESFWSSIFSPINSVSPSPDKPSPLSAFSTEEKETTLQDLNKTDSFNKGTIEGNREKIKPAATNKSLARGKSVRTIRTNQSCLVDRKREDNGSDIENVCLKESLKLLEYQNGEKQGFHKPQAEKEWIGNIENLRVKSGEESEISFGDNKLVDSDEVDKKADAFIAKFREQIRLQKLNSIKKKCR